MTLKPKFRLRPFLPLLNLLAATVLLLGAAFADGRPSVFYDSDSYDLAGRDFLELISKAPDSLTFKMRPGLDIGDDPVSVDDDLDPAMMGARSAWYGLVLHGLYSLGTLWLLATVQAFLGAWTLRLVWRSVAPGAPAWSYLALIGGLTLGSTLPFFISFAMPDVFAGIGAAGIMLFMLFWDKLRRWELVLLWLLLVAIMSFHGSHPILAIPLVLGSMLVACLLGASARSQFLRGALVIAAVVIGVVSVKAYGHAFTVRSGRELRPPPFITARLLVDGPAKRFLLARCKDDFTPFVVCRFRFQPMADTDSVLWSDEAAFGVFNIAEPRTRLKMEQEELPFALATLAYDPVGQVVASTKNWLEQIGNFWVEDPIRNPQVFLKDPYWSSTSLRLLVPDARECRPWGPGCAPPFYILPLALWHGLILLLSLGFMGWRLSRPDVREAVFRRRPDWSSPVVRLFAAALVLVAAVLVNAAVCGVLSGVFPRYQARVVWLVPLGAGLVATVLAPYAAIARVRAWLEQLQAWIARHVRRWTLPAWAAPIVERVMGHPLTRRLNAQFLRFAVVGAWGFFVHAVFLMILNDGAHLNPYLAFVLAFSIAVLATWLLNRSWTFKAHARDDRRLEEAGAYLAVQLTAFALNFTAFSTLISLAPELGSGLFKLIPLAAGACAGLGINYFGARFLVYRPRTEASAAE